MSDKVRESARFIAEHSKDVRVCKENIAQAADKIKHGLETLNYSPATWKSHPMHPSSATAATVEWIFLLDLMNFCFWSESSALYCVEYKGERYTGYWSLCAAINRAIDEGVPITSAECMRSLSKETLERVFRSDSEAPLSFFDERYNAIRDAGQVLVDKFGGSFVNVVKAADKSCQRLIELVLEHFPTFRDSAQFQGRAVYIYKRVQILVADLWACFEGRSYGEFHDIESITMFADYRVPQAMVHFGLIAYSEELLSYLRSGQQLERGHAWEIEIRGNSIWAIELVRDQLVQSHPDMQVNSILIDFFLWDYAKQHADELKNIPIHRTKTIFY
ncbi:hypothetical protein RI367_003639 [Sorochytrium milnesiophthora]